MAVPNNFGDLITTTLKNRTRKLADNVTRNNAILKELSKRSLGFMPFDGGRTIDQEISYANNTNATWYAGYETVAINPQETFSMAEYDMKMLAVAVSISGEEQLKNSGSERSINLIASRIQNAEQTMDNVVAGAMYSDGTGSGGKEIGGLRLLVADTPTNQVGGISRSAWPFWANMSDAGTFTAAGIQVTMNTLWNKLVRGNDRPRIILADNTAYGVYQASLQTIQRVMDPDWASAGFTQLAYNGACPVILDGGYQGSTAPPPGPAAGGAPSSHMYFLNTNYLHFRPHQDRNMVVMDPDRYSTNQDAVIKLIGWAGNMTLSNSFLQGVLR